MATAGMATTAAAARPLPRRVSDEEHFGPQPARSSELPDPRPLLENLTRCVIEILAGARDLEQIARWVDDSVYKTLLTRVMFATRARQTTGRPATRPVFSIGSLVVCEPRDGVVEAVVVVVGRARARAVAIRLEGLDRRWRATALHVL
ncbi:Rv3235 family protein [Salinibacterium sp. ZJ70]|uniref:Rv3235 family protein n=1 Tax=Salinibacterium sp. ZJ70 TaxID=2708084 RepID=UPI001CD42D97|nr:Rv3235 family protein [Salinibacterium sp. ZJ70]